MSFLVVLLIVLSLVLYFLPAMIASTRRATNAGTIFVIDLLFGWTVIGWIGALVWACTDKADASEGGARHACPFCAEMIMRAAKVCPHCRHDLPVAVATPIAEQPEPAAAIPVIAAADWRSGDFVAPVLAAVFLIGLFYAGYTLTPRSHPPAPVALSDQSPVSNLYGPPVAKAVPDETVEVQRFGGAPFETVAMLRLTDIDRYLPRIVNSGHHCGAVFAAWEVHPAGGDTVTRVDCGKDGFYMIDDTANPTRVTRWNGIIGR